MSCAGTCRPLLCAKFASASRLNSPSRCISAISVNGSCRSYSLAHRNALACSLFQETPTATLSPPTPSSPQHTTGTQPVHARQLSRSKPLPPQLDKLSHNRKHGDDAFITYHRVVRFQATDGGFLLVESDGRLRKVPRERVSDPRTLVTLFPRVPRPSVGKTPTRVRSGDWVYVVHGSSASLQSGLGVSQADSVDMTDGPQYLMNDVRRHDANAAQRMDTACQQHASTASPKPLLSKQRIRQQQLGQAFTLDADVVPTTLWRLVQVPETHTGAEIVGTLPTDCLRHGAQCHIFQNRNVVCYEIPVSRHDNAGNRPSSLADAGASGPSARRSSSESREEPTPRLSETPTRSNAAAFAHVWLQETPTLPLSYHPSCCQCHDRPNDADMRTTPPLWDNTWQICDVGACERQDASRRVRQALRKKKLPTPSALEDSGSNVQEGPIDDTMRRVPGRLAVAATAESRQTRAAHIIVRFFRRFLRGKLTLSRTHDVVLRKQSHQLHTSSTRSLQAEQLTANEQLKLLQCYNPHVYGRERESQRPRRDLTSAADARHSDQRTLAAMKSGVDTLNRDWLRTETLARPSLAASSSIARMTNSRRPLSSPLTPQRLRANRERERQFLVEMKMATSDLPSFRFGARPHTAPLATIRSETLGSRR